MSKLTRYGDIILLIIIGFLINLSVIRHFVDGYNLTINLYFGIFCWLIIILFKVRGNKAAKFSVIGILLLATFNIVSFSVENIAFGVSNIFEFKGFYFTIPSINPVFLVVLIIYSIINSVTSMAFYRKVFGPSDEEIDEEYKSQAKFYYEKFSASNSDELEYAKKNIKEYPKPAQEALKIIIKREENV